jgi:hypothetical protein
MLDLISTNRLDSYITILKTKDHDESLRAYYWNKALAASLYPALQCLEITLRNALDIAIQKNPPTGGLYGINDWWFKNLVNYMGDKKIPRRKRRNTAQVIIKTLWEEDQIEKVMRGFNRKSVSYNAPKIIAGLDFGFWTNLLTDTYEDTGSSTLLWPNLLPSVFPNAPAGTSRQQIQDKMDRVREFRNRISHHEPVWKFYYQKPGTLKPDYTRPVFGRAASISLLSQQFDEIIEIIGWIDKDRADYLQKSKVCSAFHRICNEKGFQAYLSPKNISTIKISRATKIRHMVRRVQKGEIFSITRNKNIVAIIGADIPID